MNEAERGQVSASAAEVYEGFFVPALFEQWTGPIVELAEIRRGDRVLDVACGTGTLARAAVARAGSPQSVVGIDCNAGMLSVARRIAPGIEWREGLAERLPFADGSFEAVVSQFGLMFFEDPQTALREMWRVLRPGGRLVVAVWAELEQAPGYAALVDLLDRRFGPPAAEALRTPFALGNRGRLASLFAAAGIDGVEIDRRGGTARFPSLRAWLTTDVKGWTLEHLIDDDALERLIAEADVDLRALCGADGRVTFSLPAQLVRARRHAAAPATRA